jgi:serine/threonine-protein kinase
MTPELWRTIEALYRAASEVPAEQRESLLLRANPEVRRAVEAMLAQDALGSNLLDHPAWEQAGNSLQQAAPGLAPGAQLGPYRIDNKLGEGGMGAVYRATDTRLNRRIAIKVSAEQFSERFKRESTAIAALNHHNICQIYDVGPNYLVMEYVEGAPIKGPLPVEEALSIAKQIVAALEAAHVKGIIHRDLKPANILVSPAGAVKLLDFGLAKQSNAEPETDATLSMGITQSGMILGTPAYMSPEQAEGKPADARADIFAFGAVLYELLSGRRAFSGASTASTMGAVIHKDPDPIDAPPRLAALVSKCLSKSPQDRYQSATELRHALDSISLAKSSFGVKRRDIAVAIAGAVAIASLTWAVLHFRNSTSADTIGSIAVLPLEIHGDDPEADYISDGITESINNALSRLPDLKVIPHSVALHYKGKPIDALKAGTDLNADTVLTGRITQKGDALTIAVELDEIHGGKQLWGDQYVRKVSDLLAVQREISGEVAQRLRAKMSIDDRRRILARGSTENPEAYQLYLKGKYHTNKFTKDEFKKGIDFFNQAIEKDPNYAAAYGGKAYFYILQDDWYLTPKDAASRAKDAAQQALKLDDMNADAHFALALVLHWYEWDWPAAESEFKQAIASNPGYADPYCLYSWFLADMGRNDEAVSQAVQGRKTDPLSLVANFTPGSLSVFTGKWDLGLEQLGSAIDLDKTYWIAHVFLGRAYEAKRQFPQAIAEFKAAQELDPDHSEIWSALGHVYAVSGQKTKANKVLEHLTDLSHRSYVAPYNVAVIYAGLGEKNQAFTWLERSYQDRGYYMPVYLPTDSRLEVLKSDPRFADLRRRIGLPQ